MKINKKLTQKEAKELLKFCEQELKEWKIFKKEIEKQLK